VEILEVLLVLGVFIPLLLVGVWQLNRVNPNKRAAKAGDSSIKELYSVYNQQVNDVLKIKDKQISSLAAKLRSFDEEAEEEPEEIADLIENPEIQKLLQAKGINPNILRNPVIQKYVKKYTKGMTMEQVLEIAGQFGLLKGSKESKAPFGANEQTQYNKDWA